MFKQPKCVTGISASQELALQSVAGSAVVLHRSSFSSVFTCNDASIELEHVLML